VVLAVEDVGAQAKLPVVGFADPKRMNHFSKVLYTE
jgi:hypothetical protein